MILILVECLRSHKPKNRVLLASKLMSAYCNFSDRKVEQGPRTEQQRRPKQQLLNGEEITHQSLVPSPQMASSIFIGTFTYPIQLGGDRFPTHSEAPRYGTRGLLGSNLIFGETRRISVLAWRGGGTGTF